MRMHNGWKTEYIFGWTNPLSCDFREWGDWLDYIICSASWDWAELSSVVYYYIPSINNLRAHSWSDIKGLYVIVKKTNFPMEKINGIFTSRTRLLHSTTLWNAWFWLVSGDVPRSVISLVMTPSMAKLNHNQISEVGASFVSLESQCGFALVS